MIINFDVFKDVFFKLSKLDINKYRSEQVERRLRSYFGLYFNLQPENDDVFSLAIAELRSNHHFITDTIDAMTINHSYFFRNKSHWDFFKELIDSRISKNQKTLKIWSAGCSSGEEPYTISMLMHEYFPKMNFSLYASDIDETILERARIGNYDVFSFEQIDDTFLNKYFTKEDEKYKIKDFIKESVQFSKHDLLHPFGEKNFDFIICRNVLIYFTPEGKNAIFHNISNALKQEGVFFCGPTEQIFIPEQYSFELIRPSFYLKR